MIRLTRFHAQNFRSLADVRLDDLPEVVLLYGENDVGKSNILRAVGAWLKLVDHVVRSEPDEHREIKERLWIDPEKKSSQFPLDRRTAEGLLGRPLEAQLRHEHVRMGFDGKLRVAGLEFELAFEILVVNAAAVDNEVCVLVTLRDVEWPGIGALRGAVPASDPARIALREELSEPWRWISSERRFHPERTSDIVAEAGTPEADDGGDQMPAPNGRGLLRSLFRAQVGTDRAVRQLFEQRFVRMLVEGPFPLDAPRPVLDDLGWLDLWVGDRSIREHGSGPRQWALIAGMIAMSGAGIVGIEEPEANLSREARLKIAQRLLAEVRNPGAPPYQMFITSHDGTMYEASGGEVWFHVTSADGATLVAPRKGPKGLDLLVPVSRIPAAPKGSIRLYPGGVVAFPDRIVKHMGAEVGSYLYALLGEPGEIRLLGEDHYDDLVTRGTSDPEQGTK